MSHRLGMVMGIVVILVAGCGRAEPAPDPSAASDGPRAQMCDRLELPVEWMRKDDLGFEQLLTETSQEAEGVRAGIALLGPGSASDAGQFRPSLKYLSKRFEAESGDSRSTPPPPSERVIRSAKELDRFLADGGCG